MFKKIQVRKGKRHIKTEMYTAMDMVPMKMWGN